MREFDNRRAKYVPLDVFVAFDDFGTRLIDKWGMEGLCGWMLFLAAAKREVTQGLFTYTSEAEAWSKFGATASVYTLDEFFTYTGRCKKTKRTRHGRITYVKVLNWKKWNTPKGNGQNPRKPDENTGESQSGTSELPQNRSPEAEAEQEARSRTAEQEAEVFALPANVDIQVEVEKLMRVLRNVEANSESELKKRAVQLPLFVVADLRQRAETDGGKGVGWAINAMEGEIAARRAAA